MPALPLTATGFVLLKRPPAEAFQTLTLFSPEHGQLLVLQRLSKKSVAGSPPLDLFDEAALQLESSNQGRTWFVREVRLITRHADLGRSYDALRLASALAALVTRNPVAEESRGAVSDLLRQALAAFAAGTRPDVVWFKSLYRFARDEGHPVREHWFPTLPAADRAAVGSLLNQPLSAQTARPAAVERLTARLAEYLTGHTEILLE